VKHSLELRLAAVAKLAGSEGADATVALLAAWAGNTPKVREAILEAVFSRRDRLAALLDALERKAVAPAALSPFQHMTLRQATGLEQTILRKDITRLESLTVSLCPRRWPKTWNSRTPPTSSPGCARGGE
jgi:hypothetical protein